MSSFFQMVLLMTCAFINIKHDFPFINNRMVTREMLKTDDWLRHKRKLMFDLSNRLCQIIIDARIGWAHTISKSIIIDYLFITF